MAPTPRQTLSYLRTLFQERGIRPKNKLGQNFLIDLNLIDLVVRSAEMSNRDVVLEVGSGTGSLTMKLLEAAGAVVSVELDTAFAALTDEAVKTHFTLFAPPGDPASTRGARPEHVKLIHGDALRNKNELNPAIFEALNEFLAHAGVSQVKLVANLPYAVAVPVISNLLLTELPVERMVVTVQWEIAERLMAVPGSKDYAALAVMVQSLADVTLLRRLGPSVFFPRPQVDSAIVLLRPDAGKRAHVRETAGAPRKLRNFLRDLYTHRRKNLRGALAGMPSGVLPKAEVDGKLAQLGIDGNVRAEALDIETHLRLCQAFG